MDAPASMKLQMLAGISPSQTAYMNQPVANGYITSIHQDNLLVPQDEDEEPPAKRRRTSDESDPTPPSFLPHEHIETVNGAPNTSVSNGIHDLNNSFGEISSSVNRSTPNPSAVSTTLLSSVEPSNTSSPPSTPTQSIPPPPRLTGISVLDNNKVDASKCRPRASIPSNLSPYVYGQQRVVSAENSRLNPYALHPKEQELLQDHLCHMHVTIYLNIRNGILRLWQRNAMVCVTREEALGCAKEYRWMNIASIAYDWLARNGYINFGCAEVPMPPVPPRRGRRKEGPVIAVVGAGVAGLGCARQLEGLFRHYRDADTEPRVVVIEGRQRIGGRVYSHPLVSMETDALPPGLVPKADMGAQIIVGFDHGNPLDQVVRGQLALHHHMLRDISTIYDIDGSPVSQVQDAMDQKLYNDVLDRTGSYRHKALVTTTAEGDHEMIDNGRESTSDDGLTVRQYEEARAAGTAHLLVATKRVRRRRGVGHQTANDQLRHDLNGDITSKDQPAALICQTAGWELKPGHTVDETLDLDPVASETPTQTLGAVMDEGVKQYQQLLPLTPKDMRLVNWHFANLEYANATNVRNLSLPLWDQDIGNEFEGEHAQVIGGYQQLPYGLYSLPTNLDVRTNKIVTKISYNADEDSNRKNVIYCEDGETFTADHVVFTGSLGVLKHRTIEFDPPLPDWKTGAIDRLGFGVMNKVVLVFPEPFWDLDRDMFGLLSDATSHDSMAQEDYAANRGRFYLFWNCVKTTGLPVLIGLMTGDAAQRAEVTPDSQILTEAMGQLRNVYKHTVIPDPLETIITRWASDKFTRGSYSYVAPGALPDDYRSMAKRVGNLHFAGEATHGTHPATVHGAYLSALRAASEVIDSVVGPIEIPTPLVPPKGLGSASRKNGASATTQRQSTTAPSPSTAADRAAGNSEKQRRESYEQAMWAAIHAEIGPTPKPPAKAGVNPFLLYQKDFWVKCRAQCDDARRAATNNPNARATRDEIRAALGSMWRNAPAAEKQPYLDQIAANRVANDAAMVSFRTVAADWDRRSYAVKDRWVAENPFQQWVAPESESA